MAAKKVPTQLLVSPHTLDRARALAVIRRESVAEVNRQALEGAGLRGLERQHAEDISTINERLNQLTGARKSEALHVMTKRNITMSELALMKEFPW